MFSSFRAFVMEFLCQAGFNPGLTMAAPPGLQSKSGGYFITCQKSSNNPAVTTSAASASFSVGAGFSRA